MILLRISMLLGATFFCSSCVWWFFEPKVENKKKNKLQAVPRHDMNWPEFVAASKGRGLSVAQLQTRFNAADDNDDGVLTPEEIQHHRMHAARRKQEQ